MLLVRRIFSRARRVIVDRRGVTLIEAVVTASLVALTVWMVGGIMMNALRYTKEAGTRETFRQWETATSRRVMDDIFTRFVITNGCNPTWSGPPGTGFWGTIAPTGTLTWDSGAVLNYVSASNRLPASVPKLPSHVESLYTDIATRCATSRTGPTRSDQYMCLTFKPPAAATYSNNSLLSMQPVWGEFLYLVQDMTNGTYLSCTNARTLSASRPLLATMHYTLYWIDTTTQPAMFRHATRVITSPLGINRP